MHEHCSNLTVVCNNSEMLETFALAKRVAKSEVTVLLYGESGVGKEVLARYIHQNSEFSTGPFVALNCAAIPENMLESILFGYEKGTFTGAYTQSIGKFERAQNGTLLLDEISEMPLNLQAKILRVLQEKEVERIGGKKGIKLNIRIIVATNKNLYTEMKNGKFRKDLYFRVSVFPIKILSLDARKDDIIPLSNYIIQKYCLKNNLDTVKLSEDACKHLINRKWPGNIRELENTLQRGIILSKDNIILPDNLINKDLDEETNFDDNNECELDKSLQNYECKIIVNTLNKHNGCRKSTAKILGISDRTLRHKLFKFRAMGINIPAAKKGEINGGN